MPAAPTRLVPCLAVLCTGTRRCGAGEARRWRIRCRWKITEGAKLVVSCGTITAKGDVAYGALIGWSQPPGQHAAPQGTQRC